MYVLIRTKWTLLLSSDDNYEAVKFVEMVLRFPKADYTFVMDQSTSVRQGNFTASLNVVNTLIAATCPQPGWLIFINVSESSILGPLAELTSRG